MFRTVEDAGPYSVYVNYNLYFHLSPFVNKIVFNLLYNYDIMD